MIKRLAMVMAALCLALFIPVFAHATEGLEEEEFVSPTRNPHAPEYSTDHPEELSDDQIVARAFILIERKTGNVLREQNADMILFPASTTKILTALIALQVSDMAEEVVVTPEAVALPEDASLVPFKAGEVVTMQDALYGLMLRSGNEAANAIAQHVSGDIDTFVAQMNETAAMLGCTNTNFTNPHGYHNEWHQTTARDLATIMQAALNNDTFREIIRSPTYDLSATEMNPARKITNSNVHILVDNNYYYSSSIGGKTGFTSQAGYVLVEAAEKNGVELIAVAMYSGKYSRWPDTSRLFEYGFTQYTSTTPTEIYEKEPITLQLNGFATDDEDLGRLKLAIRPVDTTREVRFIDTVDIIKEIEENYSGFTNIRWTTEPRAPVNQGQVMGIITFFPSGNEEPADYELYATRSVAARLDAPPTLEEIEQRVLDDPSPFPPFSWDWVLPPVLAVVGVGVGLWFLIRKLVKRRKKKKPIPKPKKRTFT